MAHAILTAFEWLGLIIIGAPVLLIAYAGITEVLYRAQKPAPDVTNEDWFV